MGVRIMSKCMGCMKEKGESEACPHCGYVSPKEQENAAYLPEGGRYCKTAICSAGYWVRAASV